jgi:hypothetical protein
MLYVVLTVGETERDPETPDGEKPTPLQLVALVDDHVSVDEAPGATPTGLALSKSVGADGDTAARPLAYVGPLWKVQPVRSSLKATCHHVKKLALAGPPMTTP